MKKKYEDDMDNPTSDQFIIEALSEGRKPKETFMLREELLQAIKASKRKNNKISRTLKILEKKMKEKSFKEQGQLCQSLLVRQLDLDSSLDKAMDFHQERMQKEINFEKELDKLNLELQLLKKQISELKLVLSKRGRESEQIEMLKNKFMVLSEDYEKAILEHKNLKIKNNNLQKEYDHIRSRTSSEKSSKLIFNSKDSLKRIERLREQIDEALVKNGKIVKEVKKANESNELLKELESKGKSADLELKKIIKWNEKRQNKILDLEKEIQNKKNEKSEIERNIDEVENNLLGIEEKNELASKKVSN